ncbi:MAG: cyclic nucleotide-binding domain-containing protein, partial [Candidatus Omnitrophota bacterium]
DCTAVAFKGRKIVDGDTQYLFGTLHLLPDNLPRDIEHIKDLLEDANITIEFMGIIPANDQKKGTMISERKDLDLKIIKGILGPNALVKEIRDQGWLDELVVTSTGFRVSVKGQTEPINVKWDTLVDDPVEQTKLLLKERGREQAGVDLKKYPDNPTLEWAWVFVLDVITHPESLFDLIGYHNVGHFNELFEFFDAIIDHLPFKNKTRMATLIRLAIYMHDLGYFKSEGLYLRIDHEARSMERFREFVKEQSKLLSSQEVDSVLYMIDKTQMRLGEPFAGEVKLDNRMYVLLDKLEQNKKLSNLQWKDLEIYFAKHFSNADLNNSADRQLVMDTIFGGKTLALADIWGADENYLYMVVNLSKEFRHDSEKGDHTAPATQTNFEQAGKSHEFQEFADAQRLRYLLEVEDAEYKTLGMQQYLKKEKEAKGDKSQIEKRIANINYSGNIDLAIGTLESGLDTNGNPIPDLEQTKEVNLLRDFIKKAKEKKVLNNAAVKLVESELAGYLVTGKVNQQKQKEKFDLGEVLSVTEFWGKLDDASKEKLLNSSKVVEYVYEDVILDEDKPEADEGVFVVLSGQLAVKRTGYTVATLGPGMVMGEMGAIENLPRTARVEAATAKTELINFPAEVFRELYEVNPDFKDYMDALIEERIQHTNGIAPAQTEDSREKLIRERFNKNQVDAVVFIDINLMRLTNAYAGKENVNLPLDFLMEAIAEVNRITGQENSVHLRRGGDEFVLAINTNGNKDRAVEIANIVKEKVESMSYALGSLGIGSIDPEIKAIIKQMGGRTDTVGRHTVLIVPQQEGGLKGKEKLNEFIEIINDKIDKETLFGAKDFGHISLQPSWLDNLHLNQEKYNQASFSLSIGLAQKEETQIHDVDGEDSYEKTHNFAAHRKDASKEVFKNLGQGYVESEQRFSRKSETGESITTTDEAKQQVKDFQALQEKANILEKMGISKGALVPGISFVRYYSSQDSFRSAVDGLRNKQGVITFAMQVYDYHDDPALDKEDRKIEQYDDNYRKELAEGKVAEDNRNEIRDFKVNNEAYGYIAGDEVIARIRMSAMQNIKIFEIFDVILSRGPPSGPVVALVPKKGKEKEAENLTLVQINSRFEEFINAVTSDFNRPSKIKIGRINIIWDRFTFGNEPVGKMLERLNKTRTLKEYSRVKDPEQNIIKYDASVELDHEKLEEDLAWKAVEQLNILEQNWLKGLALQADDFVPKNEVEEKIGGHIKTIIAEHNRDVSDTDKANRMINFRFTESRDKFIQEGGKLWARIVISFEDGHKEEYIFKEEYSYAMDEIGCYVLKILGIAASDTRRYGNNLFLIKPIGQFNMGKIQNEQYRNPEFMQELSRLSGRAAASAFILGLADRKAENIRVILDEQGMPKNVMNADLASTFAHVKETNMKYSLTEVSGILYDLLSGASKADVSMRDFILIINAFLGGFEKQLLDFQNSFQKISADFENINPDNYDRLDRMYIVMDNVKARSQLILDRINPEITKYDYIRSLLLGVLLNKISRYFSTYNTTDFMSQFFAENGTLFPRMQSLLLLLSESNNSVLKDNSHIYEEIFEAFNGLGVSLSNNGNYQFAIICDNFSIAIGKILMDIDQSNQQMWQTRISRAEARLQESIDKAAAFQIKLEELKFQQLLERELSQAAIGQAI